MFQAHPGTMVYNPDLFSGFASLGNIWKQIDGFGQYLVTICERHPEGVHLVGYSQGGLIARAILQSFDNLNVRNFISLSAPQGGQYGSMHFEEQFISFFLTFKILIFTSFLVAAYIQSIFPHLRSETLFNLVYSPVGQETSVGNYWKDPHHQDLYNKHCTFLPSINNEVKTQNSSRFRENLLKVNEMILVGGPDDSVIEPWESRCGNDWDSNHWNLYLIVNILLWVFHSHFAYFDENEKVVPFYRQTAYENDDLGLKTLNTNGRLRIITLPNIHHLTWHTNTTVIQQAVIPYLDK